MIENCEKKLKGKKIERKYKIFNSLRLHTASNHATHRQYAAKYCSVTAGAAVTV
jgi:hypothetical protein